MQTQDFLFEEARKLVTEQMELNSYKNNDAAHVACALITKKGNVYTGVNLSIACALGFCAETAAVAEMLKHRETEIDMIIAVKHLQTIIPPCGRCRELLVQVDKRNLDTKVIIAKNEIKPIAELLPDIWLDRV